MAKIQEEMRKYLSDNSMGKEVQRENFKFMFGEEDCHYPGTLISGCKLLEKCVDFASAFAARRDGGMSNLFAHMEADILYSVHTCDVMEVICWKVKDGNKSRVIGFEMYKIEEYDKAKDYFNMLEEPILCVKGECVCVLTAVPHV